MLASFASVALGLQGHPDPWGFDEAPVETWADILRPQALDLALLTAFFVLALVSFRRKSVPLKYVTLIASVLYMGVYKSQLISVVNVFGTLTGNLPIFAHSMAWYAFATFTVVTTVLGAGNHDPAMFDDPNRSARGRTITHAFLIKLKDDILDDKRFLNRMLLSTTTAADVIGADTGLRNVMDLALRAAPLASTVLLLGETGVGNICNAPLRPGDGGERHAPGETLRGCHEIGNDTFVVNGKPPARACKARLDLVGDEESTIVFGPFGQRRQETIRRHNEPTFTLDGFNQNCRDVVGADGGLNLCNGARRCLGTAQSITEGVGRRNAVHLGGERSKPVLVGHVLGREGHREIGAAVVGVVHHHNGVSSGRESRNLDGVLHRFGTRVEERRRLRVIAGSDGGEFFAHFDVFEVGRDHEARVSEVRDLGLHGGDECRHSVTNGRHRDTRAEIEKTITVDVNEDGALGSIDVDRKALRQTVAH